MSIRIGCFRQRPSLFFCLRLRLNFSLNNTPFLQQSRVSCNSNPSPPPPCYPDLAFRLPPRMTTPHSGLLDSSDFRNRDRDPSPVPHDADDHAVTAPEAENDEDGFRTPTSSEHKIPALTECPPAPAPKRLEELTPNTRRKRRRPSRLEEDECETVKVVDLPSEEFESFFKLRSQDDATPEQGNKTNKRARIDDDHDRDGNPCL